jgi:hypothetical protein
MNKTMLALGVFALWFVPSVGQLTKYTGTTGTVILAATGLPVTILLITWINRNSPELLRSSAARLMPLLVAVTIIVFAVLYPISKSALVGLGSDRDDALDVALRELLHGSYPYYARTYLGNPPTPAPGALLLAAPFFAIGSSALQNLFWLPLFLYYSRYRIFYDPLCAVVFYSIFFLACPGALQDFVTGGDYLVNAVYVSVAVSVVVGVHATSNSVAAKLATYLFLAVAVSSRAIYGITIPVLAIFVSQRDGVRAAIGFICAVGLFMLAINGPFFAYDPSNFAPLTLDRKLGAVPGQFYAPLAIPVASILIASLSALVRLDQSRVFMMIGLALAPAFIIPILFEMSARGWTSHGMTTANYFLPVTVYGGIWLIARHLCRKNGSR